MWLKTRPLNSLTITRKYPLSQIIQNPPLQLPPCSLNSDPSAISMAASISASRLHKPLPSSFHGGWGSSICGETTGMLAKSVPEVIRVAKPVRFRPVMKNVNEGKGVFAPAVVLARNIIGKKRFNQLRGKAIALHSQVN